MFGDHRVPSNVVVNAVEPDHLQVPRLQRLNAVWLPSKAAESCGCYPHAAIDSDDPGGLLRGWRAAATASGQVVDREIARLWPVPISDPRAAPAWLGAQPGSR